MAYRTTQDILIDIMKVISEEEKPLLSTITRIANVTHYVLHQRLDTLKSLGYIEQIIGENKFGTIYDKYQAYQLTNKGKQAFTELLKINQRFHELLPSV